MSTMQNNKHGGKRAGAGAPKKTDLAKNRCIKLTDSDWIKFRALGGAKWLRKIMQDLSH